MWVAFVGHDGRGGGTAVTWQLNRSSGPGIQHRLTTERVVAALLVPKGMTIV